MEIAISLTIEREVSDICRDYGYAGIKDFIEDALRRQILALKKADFLDGVSKVEKKMEERGVTEQEILRDFDRFRHQK